MQEKKKISIEGVPETMLQTLYARAMESQKPKHYIYDEKAIEIVSQFDYNFSKAESDKMMSSGVIARTIVLDKLVGDFLSQNSNAVVLNLACGMDTRCYRMGGKYARWYNVDLPETMHVRKLFLEENGPIYQIAESATNDVYMNEVEYHGEPVLVVIEGLTMYLSEEEVKKIFAIIQKKFEKAVVLVETMTPFVVNHITEKSIEGSKAKFTWGVKNGKELEKLIPSFRSRKDVSLVEGMKVFMPVYKVLEKIPVVRNISNKILVMEI